MSLKIPGFYTVREAADELNLAEVTVRHYCFRGVIQAEKLGMSWIISQHNLNHFQAHRRPRGNPNLGKPNLGKPRAHMPG